MENLSAYHVYSCVEQMLGRVGEVRGIGDAARSRLAGILAHCEGSLSGLGELGEQEIIGPHDAAGVRDMAKLLILAQIRGGRSAGFADLRDRQGLVSSVFEAGSVEPRYMRDAKKALSWNSNVFPADTVSRNTYDLSGTDFVLRSMLTGVREHGFRPNDPDVARKISGIAADEGVRYFVSSRLMQSQTPFVFPDYLWLDGRVQKSAEIEKFGTRAFRTENRADASIINFPLAGHGPKIGHFSAIAGAGFGQLIEVDAEGQPSKHANVFFGPNNLFGGEDSVLKNTIEEGNFDVSRTFLILEHAEGDVYAIDIPDISGETSPEEVSEFQRNQAWVNRIRQRLGQDALKAIVSGRTSMHLPRLGKKVFDLREAVRQEALFCGLSEGRIIVDETCPTTTQWGKHHSNTVETAFVPGSFVPPNADLPATNLLLWPRNGYFTWLERRGEEQMEF